MPEIDYYEVLGIARGASDQDVRRAYRRLALEWHPDKNAHRPDEATRMFRLIAEAYEVLREPATRQAYDAYGHAGVRGGPTPAPAAAPGWPGFGMPPRGGGFPFQFHDPFDVFRDFFGANAGDPFAMHSAMHAAMHSAMHQHMHAGFVTPMSSFNGFGALPFGGPFGPLQAGAFGSPQGSGTSFSISSSSSTGAMGHGGGQAVSETSQVQIVNGRRVQTTTRTVRSGGNVTVVKTETLPSGETVRTTTVNGALTEQRLLPPP